MNLLVGKIQSWVRENRETIVEAASDLVRYHTVNSFVTGNERDCQQHVANVLRNMNLSVHVFSPEEVDGFHQHPAYFPGKDYTNRPNVVGVQKGSGGGRSLIFSSHIDTTVVAPGWVRDPFAPTVEDGKLFGLGTYDMKGGLAASIMAVRCLQDLGVPLSGDVLIESVVDEEFGGANGTLASRIMGFQADAAIIPEPTNLNICPAHRGGAQWRVTFTGNTGMSFSGEEIKSPVDAAARFILSLGESQARLAGVSASGPWFPNASPLPAMVTRLTAGDLSLPLNDTGPSTCDVDVWVECYPGVSEEMLRDALLDGYRDQYGDDGVNIEFRKMIRFLPGSQVRPEFPLIDMLVRATEETLEQPACVTGAPFACDAFMFNRYSPTPAIILGPSGANAHAPEEFVEIDGLCKLVEIYARTIMDWCGVAGQ